MIVPMTRYDFLLYHADVESFMEHLRTLGVVDITQAEWEANPEQRAMMARLELYRESSRHLASISKSSLKREARQTDKEMRTNERMAEQAGVAVQQPAKSTDPLTPFESADAAVEAYTAANDTLTQLSAERMKATAELDRLEMWGEFDPEMVARLKTEKGITIRFFEMPTKRYSTELEAQYPIEVVAVRDGQTYFVVAQSQQDGDIEIEGSQELRAPVTSYAIQEQYIENLIGQEAVQEHILARAAMSREAIDAEYVKLKDKLDFSRALDSGEKMADNSLRIVAGFSTTAQSSSVESFANEQGVIFTSRDATVEDNPPIKLHNNFFARLFEPVGALYMLPRYNELDLTPYFAPFFMIFFGVCFGDAGYGALLLLAVIVMWKKIPAKFLDYARFAIYLAVSTIVFGFFTGNCFGIELAKVQALVEFQKYFISPESMFNVALGMGAVQIICGQILRVFNRIKRGGGFVYGLSAIGWVLLMVGGAVAFLGVVPGFTTASTAFMAVLAIAGVLILFFNSPGKNPLVNLGAGLYSCYEMATGVIGDLISYVRLFAIGLAGAIIAQVFNALAEGMSGDIPGLNWIIMAIILLIGHGMTIFISILGAFVHPVRLTFVEFFKNAEFDGGGRAFKPFRRNELES